jgi:hypothetical protein
VGFRDPVTSATALDTGDGFAVGSVRVYPDNNPQPAGAPASTSSVVEFRDGIAGDLPSSLRASAYYTGDTGPDGGPLLRARGGSLALSAGSWNGIQGPALSMGVEELQAGGYGDVTRLTGSTVHLGAAGGTVQLDGKLTPAATGAPTYLAGGSFTANPASPLTLTKDPAGVVRARGLHRNATVTVANIVGQWFTMPVGFRPTRTEFALVLVEGGGLCYVSIDAAGVVAGVGWLVNPYGASGVGFPHYWSWDTEYQT